MQDGNAVGAEPLASETPPIAVIPKNRAPLLPTVFTHLPLGAVRPAGWLKRQLELQKQGLTGAAETLYDALTPASAWLGGNGEAWEKGPYYVRGLIALAYTLDDAELKQRAQKWIDWVLQSQRPDGSFGPSSNDDWWPRMIVLCYLRDYAEATGDGRVVPFFSNYFRYQAKTLPSRPLRDWGRSRAGDNIDVVLWTFNRTGDQSLLRLAKMLAEQAYPWSSIYTDNRFYGFGDDFQPHHIVNVSQALKFPPVIWQLTHDPKDRDAFNAGIANLTRQYGRIDGEFSGTEMLSNLSSTAGVELCADVERIISNGIAIDILGDPALGDQLEKVAYNSLPAHTSPRMQQITYYQLLNQATCTPGGHGFTQDYSNGNMPGPYSGFPCCCYNWHAAWPKFIQAMWATTNDDGLALIAYGPSTVDATVGGSVPIHIGESTDYPFGDSVALKIDPAKPVAFPLMVRIPGWCEQPSVRVNGQRLSGVKPGTFLRIERHWAKGDQVDLHFPMTVRTSRWVNHSVGFERGPLAFALAIEEKWKRTKDHLGDFDEFEVLPESPWNYAVQLPGDGSDVAVKTHPVS
ncbi:MAG: beta-L-arabinofuranosidase domain-containing protein, partial [Tepidisphaeraceae bacterium]